MLEIGKYYLQRNGIVVGPLREYTGTWACEHNFKFCAGAEGVANRLWREDGSFSLLENDKHSCDIVYGVQFTPWCTIHSIARLDCSIDTTTKGRNHE